MMLMMFTIVVLMLLGIAGMQYLVLCEQRATQFRLDRVRGALAVFEGRRLSIEQMMGAPFMEFIR